MTKRRIYDDQLHAQFVTFSCYRRRRLLDHPRARQVVMAVLAEYSKSIDPKQPFWQPKYYPFNLYSEKKAKEKLDYMQLNPVRAGLVQQACDWRWSSAGYYEQGKTVGVHSAGSSEFLPLLRNTDDFANKPNRVA